MGSLIDQLLGKCSDPSEMQWHLLASMVAVKVYLSNYPRLAYNGVVRFPFTMKIIW